MAHRFIKKWKIEHKFFNCANILAPFLLHKYSRISLKFAIANLGKPLQFILKTKQMKVLSNVTFLFDVV